MEYLELKLNTTKEGINYLPLELEDAGITGVIIDDADDFQHFLEDNQAFWGDVDENLRKEKEGLCCITFYVENSPDGLSSLQQVEDRFSYLKLTRTDLGPLELQCSNVSSDSWENAWMKFYKPMEIGNRLLIVPAWESATNSNRTLVVLNPGLTFGTGGHATTRLCLKTLDSIITGGEKVLDLGCGSGILSIAALCLGAQSAFACDIDEKCVDVAYENAALSHVDKSKYTVKAGNVLEDQSLQLFFQSGYDIVVANIVSDVIIALAPMVKSFLRKDGLFLVSGIIDTRKDDVLQHLTLNGWKILEENYASGWFSFLCK